MTFITSIPLPTHRTRFRPCTSTQSLEIRAAKHVQFKGAKKADRNRPKKHRPSDINRAKPSFNPEPLRADGLPPVFDVYKPHEAEAAFQGMTTLADAATVEQFEGSLEAQAEAKADTHVEADVAEDDPAPVEDDPTPAVEDESAAIEAEATPVETDAEPEPAVAE